MQRSLVIIYFLCQSLVQGGIIDVCDNIPGHLYQPPFLGLQYSYLFSKLEEALLGNQTLLNLLKHGFMSTEDILINFSVQLEVVNGTDLSSSCYNYSDLHSSNTFCPSNTSEDMWELCSHHQNNSETSLKMTYISQTINIQQLKMYNFVFWLSSIHGNLPTIVLLLIPNKILNLIYNYDEDDMTVRLKIDTLKCNPPLPLTECVLSKLLSWVKIYSYNYGNRPEIWDKKGTVIFFNHYDPIYDYDDIVDFIPFSFSEYVLVSLSLALIIASFFPAVYNQIVMRAATRLEYKSLYWGIAVVSNIFTYGLFVMEKGISILIGQLYVDYFMVSLIIVPSIQEVLVYVILFVGAVIASLGRNDYIPIPKGLAQVLINISCCFFFCCCACCSPRCRAKTMRVLVLFSFMSFVYHSIMDIISVLFLKFIHESYAFLVLMYISLLVYLFLSVSYLLFITFQREKRPCFQQCIACFGSTFMFIIVFCAVITMFGMYIFLYITLTPSGLNGIVAGLFPSITLSAASWYIRKNLLKSKTSGHDQLEYGISCEQVNTGGEDMGDDHQKLIP